MIVPIWPGGKFTNSDGSFTPAAQTFMSQTRQNMQTSLSENGFLIPSQDSSTISILQPTAQVGTLLFDVSTNQLVVLLNDLTFHPILTS